MQRACYPSPERDFAVVEQIHGDEICHDTGEGSDNRLKQVDETIVDPENGVDERNEHRVDGSLQSGRLKRWCLIEREGMMLNQVNGDRPVPFGIAYFVRRYQEQGPHAQCHDKDSEQIF